MEELLRPSIMRGKILDMCDKNKTIKDHQPSGRERFTVIKLKKSFSVVQYDTKAGLFDHPIRKIFAY